MLVSKMKLHGDRNEDVAKYLGITYQSYSYKLNGTNGKQFTCNEIRLIKIRYNLTPEEIDAIFFCN